jgi:hypothetical protein
VEDLLVLAIQEKPSFTDPCGWLDDETQKTRFRG